MGRCENDIPEKGSVVHRRGRQTHDGLQDFTPSGESEQMQPHEALLHPTLHLILHAGRDFVLRTRSVTFCRVLHFEAEN